MTTPDPRQENRLVLPADVLARFRAERDDDEPTSILSTPGVADSPCGPVGAQDATQDPAPWICQRCAIETWLTAEQSSDGVICSCCGGPMAEVS